MSRRTLVTSKTPKDFYLIGKDRITGDFIVRYAPKGKPSHTFSIKNFKQEYLEKAFKQLVAKRGRK
jgi:hypothetical protein